MAEQEAHHGLPKAFLRAEVFTPSVPADTPSALRRAPESVTVVCTIYGKCHTASETQSREIARHGQTQLVQQ